MNSAGMVGSAGSSLISVVIIFLRVVVKVKDFSAGRTALQAVVLWIVLVVVLVHGLATAKWAGHR